MTGTIENDDCEPSRYCYKVPPDLGYPFEFPFFEIHNAKFTVRLVQNPRNDEIGVFLRCLSGGPLHLPFTFLVQDESGVVLANHCDTTQVFKANVTWGKRNLLSKAKEKLVEENANLRVILVLISGCVCGETKNLRICTTCKARYYCCAEHQKQDWAKHKKVCNELAIGGITWMLRRIQTWQKNGILSEMESRELKSKICSQPHLAIFDENEKEIINLLEEKLRQLKFKNKDLEQRQTRTQAENDQLKARCIELEQEKEKLQFSSNVSTAKIKELELLKTVTEEENRDNHSKMKKELAKKRKKIEELSRQVKKHNSANSTLTTKHEIETKKLRQEIIKQHEKIYELNKVIQEKEKSRFEAEFKFEDYMQTLNFEGLLQCQQRVNSAVTEMQTCTRCHENKRQLACIPCGHFVLCIECGSQTVKCPECDAKISEYIQVLR